MKIKIQPTYSLFVLYSALNYKEEKQDQIDIIA